MATRKFRAPKGTRMCSIFMCDKRRERYCCNDCEKKEKCNNPCLNTPGKCGKDFMQGNDDTN